MLYTIISLKLVGNERLLNKGTREIHYEPKAPLQLLLGQNGFGKTTVLLELSPLPANHNEYIKGGYKEFICDFNTHRYILKSDFSKGNKHSFLKDGQELNLGGTITVQRQLVEAEFRYTQELHNLLMGITKFTALTAQKRKDLLVSLCDVDVSYAMRVFASASTNARNVQGAIKHNEQKLVETQASLLSEEDHAALTAEMAKFSEQISNLYSSKELGLHFNDSERLELASLETAITELSNRILAVGYLDLEGCKSVESFRELVSAAEATLRDLQSRLQIHSAEYDSLTSMLGQLEYTGEQKTEELIVELAGLNEAIQKIKIQPELLALSDPELLAAQAMGQSATFDDICLQLIPNPDLTVYNKETVGSYEQKRAETQHSIDRLLNRRRLSEERLAHMKAGEKNQCPDCGYIWIPGYSESKCQEDETMIERCNEGIAKHTKVLEELNEWLATAQEWKTQFLAYRNLVQANPRLEYFWNQVSAQQIVLNAPKSLVGALQRFGRQMLSVKDYKAIESRIGFLNEVLEKRRLLEQNSTMALSGRAKLLEEEIGHLTTKLEDAKAQVNKRKDTLTKLQSTLTWTNQLDRLFAEFARLTQLKARVERNSILDQAIAEINQQSGLIASKLQKSTATIEIHKHLQNVSVELAKDQEAYEVLLSELSPTDGLIADSLTGFVRAFVRQLNRVIGHIWRTPLMVFPCAVEDGGLNYRFPVRMFADKPVSDISECSKGETELINFAFTLVAAHYLGVAHYPIYMDEIGSAFSEEHKQTLYDYVKLLVETKTVNQVFIVSHFSATHGSLKHAEINVIDRTGVMITPEVNQNFRVV